MTPRDLKSRVAAGAVIHAVLRRYDADRHLQPEQVNYLLVEEEDAYNRFGLEEVALAEDYLTYVHAAAAMEIDDRLIGDELAEWADQTSTSRIDVMRVLWRARELTERASDPYEICRRFERRSSTTQEPQS